MDARFLRHFLMSPKDVIEYVVTKSSFFLSSEHLLCHEIGDGNINYIYRVTDTQTGKTLIVKQADVQTRVRPDGYLNPDRIVREALVLKKQFEYAPEAVPEVFYYDSVMAVIIMEDIGRYENLRELLLQQEIIPNIENTLSDFIVKTIFPFTDIVMPSYDKKKMVAQFINPDLCAITEDIVFTHPYKDIRKRNILFSENRAWLEKHFYHNEALHYKVALLKEKFQNYPQSLIHGDLHSGSIFVVRDSGAIKVIDPEFAFFGPIGYDLGNIFAHLVFSLVYAKKSGLDVKDSFCAWGRDVLEKLFDSFKEKGISYFQTHAVDPLFSSPRFIADYMQGILNDALLFMGTEVLRRIIGTAKVPELTRVTANETRREIERSLTRIGERLLLDEYEIRTGKDFVVFLGV